MLNGLRAVVETRMPQAFAYACLLFDRLAARDPLGEINLLPMFVAAGEAACDVGANRGLFTYWLLKRGARVTAFEPNPRMVEVLNRRFAGALRRGQLRIVQGAVSDGPGTATLHIPAGFSALASIDGTGTQAGGPMEHLEVRLTQLDECVTGDVAFLKVDVEGHELKVFEGASRLLATSKPTILVEAEERHRPGAVAALRALLEPLGYEGFFRQGAVMRPIAAFDPALHQAREALNAAGSRPLKGRDYVANFLFAARPEAIARLRAMGG